MLTIIQLLPLPLSLELNSGPRDRNPSRTAKRQPLVAVEAPSPTSETFSANKNNNSIELRLHQPLIAPLFASSPLPRASRRSTKSDSLLLASTASYRPSPRHRSVDSLLQAVVSSSRLPHTPQPLQRPTASSTRLQEPPHEPLQRPTASSTRLQEPQQASAASDSLLQAVDRLQETHKPLQRP
jgi:hypothetical protein